MNNERNIEKGKQASIDGFAHEHIVAGILMKEFQKLQLYIRKTRFSLFFPSMIEMMIPVATFRSFANAKITIVIGDVTSTDARATAPTPLAINIPSTIVYAVITITDTIGGITYFRNNGNILLVPSSLFVDVNYSIVRYTNNFYDYTSF